MDPVTIILWIVAIALLAALCVGIGWIVNYITTKPAPTPSEDTAVLDKDGNVIDEAWWLRELQESKRRQRLQQEEDKQRFDDELYQSMVDAGNKVYGPEYIPILSHIPPDSYYAGYSLIGDTIRISGAPRPPGGVSMAYDIRMGELGSFLEHLQRAIKILANSGSPSEHYELLQKDLMHLQFEFSMGLLPKPTPPVPVLPTRTNRNGNPILQAQLAREHDAKVQEAIQDAQHQLMRQQEFHAYLEVINQQNRSRKSMPSYATWLRDKASGDL